MTSNTGPEQGFSLLGRIFAILFGLAFSGIGAVFLSVIVYSTWQDLQPFFWEEAKCKILTSEFKSADGTNEPRVTYEYDWHGQRYRGNVLLADAPMNRSAGLRKFSSAAGQIAGLEVGKLVPCYVAADSPNRAVLRRRGAWYAFFLPIPLVCVVIGLACIFGAFGSGKIAPQAVSAGLSRRKLLAGKARTAGRDALPRMPTPGGASSAIFRSAKSRRTKAVVFLCMAIFWNGIIAIPILSVTGSLSFLVYLFFVPFMLVGLILLFAAANCVLALANPALEARVSLPLKLAENSSLQWSVQGKVERLEELVFTLEGKEEVTDHRDTSSSLESRVFQIIEIARLTRTDIRSRSGSATIKMPEITAPSFAAANNKIAWYLRARGVIPRWPDIDDAYPVQVVFKNL